MTKIIQFSMTQAAGYSDTYYVWNAPYTYIYMTPTAAFEKGLDDFNLFMLNTTIKLPNIYDYVYEGDDGKIYAGNTADQPAGSTRLYAK